MKTFLLAVGLLFVLLIILVVLLPFLIDLNKYQTRYLPMIEDALNRKVTLSDIKLTIVPRLGVRVAGFTVMDDPAFDSGPFASLSSLDVGVKLLPLLSGRVEVEEIVLEEPVITVIKNRQGVMNISTLGKQGPKMPEAPKEAPPPEVEGPLRALAMLAVDRVSLSGGKLMYLDQSAPKPTNLTIQDLQVLLQSVRLGEMPRLHLAAVVQPYNIPVRLDGIAGPLTETLDLQTVNADIAVGKIALAVKGRAVGGRANATLTSPMINTADLPVALPLAKPVRIKDLHIEAETTYPLKGHVDPLEIATVKTLRCAVVLGDSIINVNGSLLGGEAKVTASSSVINTADLPVSVPLRKPIDVKDLTLAAEVKGREATMENLSLKLFGGQLVSEAAVMLTSRHQPFEGKVALQGIQLGPVVDALTERISAGGTAAAQLSVRGRGLSMSELTNALEGTGSFAVKDGTIEGVNLLQEALALLKAAGIKLDATKATVFSTIEGHVAIADGVMTLNRFLLDSHDYQATATGTIGFNQALNLKVTLNLSEALSRQIARGAPAARLAMTGGRMTVPMLVRGTVQTPSYALDTKAVAGKIQERVKEQVKETVGEILKDQKLDLEKGKEALKKLFGR